MFTLGGTRFAVYADVEFLDGNVIVVSRDVIVHGVKADDVGEYALIEYVKEVGGEMVSVAEFVPLESIFLYGTENMIEYQRKRLEYDDLDHERNMFVLNQQIEQLSRWLEQVNVPPALDLPSDEMITSVVDAVRQAVDETTEVCCESDEECDCEDA